MGTGEAAGGQIPALGVVGGEGLVGEKQEEDELYLGVALVGAGMAGAGGAAERGGGGSSAPRWRCSGDREPR